MTHNAPTKRILLGAILLTGFAFADNAQEIRDLQKQKATLNQEIQELQANILNRDSLIRDDNARYKILESRYNNDLAQKRQDLDTLSSKLHALMESIQKENATQARFQGKLSNDKSKRNSLRKLLLKYCVALDSQTSKTIPWDLEVRLERIRILERDLETGNGSEEEAFSRLSALIGEEIRFGDEVQLVSAPITRKDGEVLNANLLRIGNALLLYADENSTRFGILEKTMSNGLPVYSWNENPPLSTREAIRNAIAVKQGKKAPQIVTIPLRLSFDGVQK